MYSIELTVTFAQESAAHVLARPACCMQYVAVSTALLTSSCCRAGEAAPNRRQVWIVARQHPGESMAEWFMEGTTRFYALGPLYHHLSQRP